MYFCLYTTPLSSSIRSFGNGAVPVLVLWAAFFSFRGNELGLGWLLFGILYHLWIGRIRDIRDTNTDWKFVHRRLVSLD